MTDASKLQSAFFNDIFLTFINFITSGEEKLENEIKLLLFQELIKVKCFSIRIFSGGGTVGINFQFHDNK